jgi:hypothetical protein
MNLVSVTLYISFIIACLYWVFILPGLLQSKFYTETTIISVYLICSFVFSILLNMKLDELIKISYFKSLIPLLFAIGFHLLLMIVKVFQCLKEELSVIFTTILFLCFSFISSLFLSLKLDGYLVSTGYSIPILIFFVGLCFFQIEKIYESIKIHSETEKET